MPRETATVRRWVEDRPGSRPLHRPFLRRRRPPLLHPPRPHPLSNPDGTAPRSRGWSGRCQPPAGLAAAETRRVARHGFAETEARAQKSARQGLWTPPPSSFPPLPHPPLLNQLASPPRPGRGIEPNHASQTMARPSAGSRRRSARPQTHSCATVRTGEGGQRAAPRRKGSPGRRRMFRGFVDCGPRQSTPARPQAHRGASSPPPMTLAATTRWRRHPPRRATAAPEARARAVKTTCAGARRVRARVAARSRGSLRARLGERQLRGPVQAGVPRTR